MKPIQPPSATALTTSAASIDRATRRTKRALTSPNTALVNPPAPMELLTTELNISPTVKPALTNPPAQTALINPPAPTALTNPSNSTTMNNQPNLIAPNNLPAPTTLKPSDASDDDTTPRPTDTEKRPRISPPSSLPSDLPATAAEVFDSDSLSRVVSLLSTTIVSAVYEGKSVTTANKRLIALAAEETRRAMATFVQLAKPEKSTEQTTCPENGLTYKDSGLTDIKRELLTCVREEVGKLKAELTTFARPNHLVDEQSRSYAQALGSRPTHRQLAPPPTSPPPLIPRVTKPAIIIATKTPTNTRQEVVAAWRRSITFKNSKYAPTLVKPTSGNKLRVEFETNAQRDDALSRLRDSREVNAEVARCLQPMIIIKGVSNDTPVEELSDIIRSQNPTLEGLCETDLTLKFKRNNRNASLYNAVFIVKPKMFNLLTTMGRVCIDHQRVHVEEFSPFLQCYHCLQFGHVRKNCPTQDEVCAFCAATGHVEVDCSVKKLDKTAARCYNCVKRNTKFDLNSDTKHYATSYYCPVLRAMKARVDNRVDYGSIY